LMDGQKVFKTLDFWFIDTWNDIDQLQRSGSCIRMSDVGICVGRVQPQNLLEGHKSIYIHLIPRDKFPSELNEWYGKRQAY